MALITLYLLIGIRVIAENEYVFLQVITKSNLPILPPLLITSPLLKELIELVIFNVIIVCLFYI